MPEDRADTTLTCPTCGERFDDPLEVRNHELEVHGGEGPGSAIGGDEDRPRPDPAGGSTAPP